MMTRNRSTFITGKQDLAVQYNFLGICFESLISVYDLTFKLAFSAIFSMPQHLCSIAVVLSPSMASSVQNKADFAFCSPDITMMSGNTTLRSQDGNL